MSAMLGNMSAPPKSSGHHLQELRDTLGEKMDAYKVRIDEDELTKDTLLKELKAVSLKLEEVDRRLGKLQAAKAEYVKTQQEVLFALDKLEDASGEIGNRINSFGGAGVDKGAEILKKAGL